MSGKKYTRPKRHIKLAVWERDNWLCHYCGQSVDPAPMSQSAPNGATVDHVVPRSRGGGNGRDNLVTACLECNQAKADNEAYADGFGNTDVVPAGVLAFALSQAFAMEDA